MYRATDADSGSKLITVTIHCGVGKMLKIFLLYNYTGADGVLFNTF